MYSNRWVLLACCTFYFVSSGILQLLLSFFELESILLLKGKVGPDGKHGPGVNVSTHFPRYQEEFTIGITSLPSGSLGLPWSPAFKKLEGDQSKALAHGQRQWLVSEFFDEEGFFYEDRFCTAVSGFLRDLEAYQGTEGKKHD